MMSIQEKRSIVSMFSTVLAFVVYYVIVISKYYDVNFTTAEELKFWAAVILILIPVWIVSKIIIHILFGIINTILTKEYYDWKMDEFDRLIESRASRNFYNVFTGGFLVSMGSLVLGMSPFVMFNIILFSLLTGGIVLDISQLYFYRKGV